MHGTSAGPGRASLALAVLAVLACAQEAAGPDAPDRDRPDLPPFPIVVSSPVEREGGTVAYVSATLGTLRWGEQVTVRNLSRAGHTTTAALSEGGFDPVAVPAATGDTLLAVSTDSSGNPVQTTETVAARLPIRVVRLQPAPRRTDVPLNTRVEIVFSAPVLPESAERGIRVTRQGAAVSGTVVAGDPLSLLVFFEPDEPLEPSTLYRVEVTRDVVGVNGLPLAESVLGEFRTVDGPVLNAPPVASFRSSCSGLACLFEDLSADPDAGDSIVTRVWAMGDGNVVQDRPAPVHTYGSAGSFTVTLTVTDRHGAADSHALVVTPTAPTTPGGGAIASGTYERVTPHLDPGRRTRYVVRDDGTFEFHDETATGVVVHRGHWTLRGTGWETTVFRFDSIADAHPEWVATGADLAAAGFGSSLGGSDIGISYLVPMISAGFEEGVYSRDPVTVPDVPPPQEGQIAFVRDGRIHVVSTHGGVPVQLTAGPGDGEPAWSPDGSRIAFRRAGGASPGMYVMDADGANVALLTSAEPSDQWSQSWSPDGEWVVFACSRPGGTINEPAICKVRSAGPDRTRVLVHAQGQGQLMEPAWSPDGTTLAYTSDWNAFDFSFDLWTVRADGSAARALRTFTIPVGYEQYQPAWSPDGTRIALVECPWAAVYCTSSLVAVMNADGSGSTRLVATRGYSSPTWSPDGRVIAFGTGTDIEWVSVDGLERGRILANGHSPSWRP